MRVVRDDDRGGTRVFDAAIAQSRVRNGGDLLKTHPERMTDVLQGVKFDRVEVCCLQCTIGSLYRG